VINYGFSFDYAWHQVRLDDLECLTLASKLCPPAALSLYRITLFLGAVPEAESTEKPTSEVSNADFFAAMS
jgi:hypothetical protein